MVAELSAHRCYGALLNGFFPGRKKHESVFHICCLPVPFLCDTSSAQKLERGTAVPNILLITSEDHGQHLSCYGDTVIHTPNLDKIARAGALFHNAYITAAVCSASRSSILTGLYPHQNGHLDIATFGYRLVGVPVGTAFFGFHPY